MKKRIFLAMLTVAFSCVMAGCGEKEETTENGYAKEIYLYNWSEYMTQEVLDLFEEEYGIKVVESTFESNDELLAKLVAGNEGEYDIAVPSNFYIEALLQNDLIEELDKDKIPNLANIDEAYRGLDYDPEDKYTVPYMGTVVPWIANTKIIDELDVEINSMEDLTDERLKDNIIMVDDPQGNITVGLLGCDLEPTSTNLDDIAKAKDWLMALNPNVKSYSIAGDVRDVMAKGECAVAAMYSGTALQAMAQNPDLEIVMEEEPCSLSLDTMVILKGTKHKEEAELFIDFILRPEISAKLTNEFQYVCFNKAAVDYLDEDLKNSPLCVLTDDMKERLFLINTFDGEAIDAEVAAMTEVKSAR